MRLIWRWILNALGLIGVAYLLPGMQVDSFYIALITALLLGIVNITIKPLLLFFTLPITILTFGLFAFVINALLLWFVSSFVDGFFIADFFTALLASVLLAVFSWLSYKLIPR